MKPVIVSAWALTGLILLSGCGPRTEVEPGAVHQEAESVGSPAPTSAPSCGLDRSGTVALTESEIETGLEITALFVARSGKCPTQHRLDELRHIWTQNEAFWAEYPARVDLFWSSNFAAEPDPEIRDLTGRSFDEVKSRLVSDPDFPMTQDRGPTVVGEMTLYEFSGGQTVYLVVVRNDVVSRVYFFDQV